MMHTISLHTSENLMTASAVAACMAPLLLRPLLAGECELEDDFDNNNNNNPNNSAQLLAAANAANNAQSIIATLLEEYDIIFDVSFFSFVQRFHKKVSTYLCAIITSYFCSLLSVITFYFLTIYYPIIALYFRYVCS